MRQRVNSLVVSARVDARDIATVIKGWQIELGTTPRSTSELIKEIIGVMADTMLAKHGQDVAVESHDEALEVLEQSQLKAHSTRSRRALGRGMQADLGFDYAPRKGQTEREPVADPQMEAQARRWMEEQAAKNKASVAEIKDALAKPPQ